MQNYLQIYNQLRNFQNFGIQIQVNVPPPIVQLGAVWQWNTGSALQFNSNVGGVLDIGHGEPIFEGMLQEYERFVPSSMLNHSFSSTRVGQAFIAGMRRNVQSFNVDCSRNPTSTTNIAKRGLLSMIYRNNMKKIYVSNPPGHHIMVRKTTAPLVPYDAVYPQPNIRTGTGNSGTRHITDIMPDINLNAERGFMGPGTYRCRNANCLVTGPLMTQTPVVLWGPGPGQFVNLRKRFTCACTNVVYLLYCNACLQQNVWTTYIGETERVIGNFHDRVNLHHHRLNDQYLRQNYPLATLPNTVAGILAGGPDPDLLMQDPYVHFNFVHTPQDRRYSILDGGFPSTFARKRCELQYILACGNYDYFPATNSGNLNRLTIVEYP